MTLRLDHPPMPHLPHRDTLTSGRHGYSVSTEDGLHHAVLYYCPQNRVSAVYELAQGHWNIRTPDTFAEFLIRLTEIGVVIPDNEESRDWIEACGLSPARGDSVAPH